MLKTYNFSLATNSCYFLNDQNPADDTTNESNESNDSQIRTENLTLSSESGGISNPEYYEENKESAKAMNVQVVPLNGTPAKTSSAGKVHLNSAAPMNILPSSQQIHSKRNSSFLPFPFHVTPVSTMNHSPTNKTVLKVLSAKNENSQCLPVSSSNFVDTIGDNLQVQTCENGVPAFQHVATFRSKPSATETNV